MCEVARHVVARMVFDLKPSPLSASLHVPHPSSLRSHFVPAPRTCSPCAAPVLARASHGAQEQHPYAASHAAHRPRRVVRGARPRGGAAASCQLAARTASAGGAASTGAPPACDPACSPRDGRACFARGCDRAQPVRGCAPARGPTPLAAGPASAATARGRASAMAPPHLARPAGRCRADGAGAIQAPPHVAAGHLAARHVRTPCTPQL